MARGVAVLGAEGGAEGVYLAQRGGAEFALELAADGEGGELAEEVLLPVDGAVLLAGRVLGVEGGDMEHLTGRPEELKEEIFKRLFKTAEIATFTPEERIKYENDMTTERDIQNYISYAREKGLEEGMEKGREEGRIEAARNMLADEISIDLVAKYTGLSIEQVKELKL